MRAAIYARYSSEMQNQASVKGNPPAGGRLDKPVVKTERLVADDGHDDGVHDVA
jgi:hypothetical protein